MKRFAVLLLVLGLLAGVAGATEKGTPLTLYRGEVVEKNRLPGAMDIISGGYMTIVVGDKITLRIWDTGKVEKLNWEILTPPEPKSYPQWTPWSYQNNLLDPMPNVIY